MANIDVLHGPDSRGATAAGAPRADDRLAHLLLWLIPALAFVAALLR